MLCFSGVSLMRMVPVRDRSQAGAPDISKSTKHWDFLFNWLSAMKWPETPTKNVISSSKCRGALCCPDEHWYLYCKCCTLVRLWIEGYLVLFYDQLLLEGAVREEVKTGQSKSMTGALERLLACVRFVWHCFLNFNDGISSWTVTERLSFT